MSIQSNVTENPTVAKVKAEATAEFNGLMTVSYTHLTLPTKRIV